MNLLEVRTEFVKQTGRYDLVIDATSYADNGADYYLKAGQRTLDRLLEYPKDEGEMTISLATSALTTSLTNVMSIRAVAVVDSQDNTLRYIDRRSIKELREQYGHEVSTLANVTAAEPIAWALGHLRTNVAGSSTAEGGSKLLITMPPTDRSYQLLLTGLFGSVRLSGDTSVSFWSIVHPDVLVWAGMYQLDVSYRNFEGSKAIMANILDAVRGIDNEVVEQMQVGQSQLKDSHRFITDPIRHRDRYI